ncbi:MAG: hypothetical protein KDC71_24105, partial [Acidobacteria bacterium]|nr:hypothetical protein [Acidobacteriota bacterium]
GFVLACLFSNAIDLHEFKLWVDHIIAETPFENIPPYIFDLVDFNEALFHVYRVIGFVPGCNLNEKEEAAIYGIAIARGREVYDLPVPATKAMHCLSTCEHIQHSFQAVFPFLPTLKIPA